MSGPTGASEMVDALPHPVMALDVVEDATGFPDLCIGWSNEAARRRFGDRLTGRWLRRDEPFGPMDGEVAAVVTGRRCQTVDRTRNGEIEHYRCTLVPLEAGAMLMVQDIAEEIEMRGVLSSNTDALARVQHWGKVGVWEVDIDSGAVYWSTQVFELLGIDRCGLEEFRSVVHPEDRSLIDHLRDRVLAQPGPYQVTHRILRGDDVRTVDQYVQSVADERGRPVRLIGTIVDVTETQRLRDHIRQADQARTIGLVAAGVAHDFNNLLTVVEGNASLLLSQTDDESLRTGLEAIKRAAARASTTTRKLMSLGRQDELDLRPVAVASVFADVAGWARPTAPGVSIIEHAGDDDPVAMADAGRLRRLLLDLVLNARDAEAATVRLEARRVDLDRASVPVDSGAVPAGRYVRIDIADDGKGMDETTRGRALEPFFSTKSQDSGSGLGLANAAVHVTQMAGHLDLDSEPGRGTTVTLLLPAHGPALPTGTERVRATRVVVASSDADLAEAVGAVVAGLDHQVVVASDARTLAFCLRSEPIDAAVVDERMEHPEGRPPELGRLPTIWLAEPADAADPDSLRDRIVSLVEPGWWEPDPAQVGGPAAR